MISIKKHEKGRSEGRGREKQASQIFEQVSNYINILSIAASKVRVRNVKENVLYTSPHSLYSWLEITQYKWLLRIHLVIKAEILISGILNTMWASESATL